LTTVAFLRSTTKRARRPSHLALAVLYVFVVLGSAFLHHDFDCHEKSRTHCTSCVFSQTAAGVAAEAPIALPPTAEVTSLVLLAVYLSSTTPIPFGTDRAPPLA
jgi:hypothetical protein